MLLSGLWFELVSSLVPVSSLSMRLVLHFVLRHSFSVFCSSLPPFSFLLPVTCYASPVLAPHLHEYPLPLQSPIMMVGSRGLQTGSSWCLSNLGKKYLISEYFTESLVYPEIEPLEGRVSSGFCSFLNLLRV